MSGALGVWLVCLAVLAALDESMGAAGRVAWPIVALAAGVLILLGLIGLRRGSRGGRPVLAAGAIVGGMISIWAVIPAVSAIAIVVWLYGPRRLRRAPTQPA